MKCICFNKYFISDDEESDLESQFYTPQTSLSPLQLKLQIPIDEAKDSAMKEDSNADADIGAPETGGKVYTFTPPVGRPTHEKTPVQMPEVRPRRERRAPATYTPSDYEQPKRRKANKNNPQVQIISNQNEASVIKDLPRMKSRRKVKGVSQKIDFDTEETEVESVKPTFSPIENLQAATNIKVHKHTLANIPQVFLGEGDDSDKVKAGYTMLVDETGFLSWFNSISQLIQEMIRRQGPIKSPNYNQKAKFKGAFDQEIDTLYTYLTWDCSLQVVSPENIVKHIATEYIGIDEAEVELFVRQPQVAEAFFGLFAQMTKDPKYPEMKLFDFMVNIEVYTRACHDCGEHFSIERKPPSSYTTLEIKPGWTVADHFEDHREQRYKGCCSKCHKHTSRKHSNRKLMTVKTSLTFEKTPEFITVHLNRLRVKENGEMEYIRQHVEIGGNIKANDTIFKPIAVLSQSADTRQYWSYLNRGKSDGEDQWYCIKNAEEPVLVEKEIGPHGILMVVYSKSRQTLQSSDDNDFSDTSSSSDSQGFKRSKKEQARKTIFQKAQKLFQSW